MPNQPVLAHSRQELLAAIEIWLLRVLSFVSVGFILLFLYTSLRRMGYPFSFDQVEGGTVTSVWRIAHGYPLYSKPTLDFVPYLYAPLYLYLAAGLSKIVGVGYVSLRLLSILGTLGSLGVIYALIHGETRSRLASVAGAGLYAACYHPLEAWFDVGRVDSLFVFLFLLAIYCTRRAPILLAVLVWLIAFQTKQTILPVAVLVLCTDWQRPRRMVLGLATFLAGVTASILIMNHLTEGWYSYYLFGTAKGLPWILRPAVLYIPSDLLQPFGLALLILLACLLCVPPKIRGRNTQFYLIVSFAIYASIWYQSTIAVIDANTMKMTGKYDLSSKSGGCAGLALDTKNNILFAACREKNDMVILSATDGHIIADLPIGQGCDGATFNPVTMEAFSSQGDATLTVIKENSPMDFVVEQNVTTPVGAKTITLDPKTGHLFLIAASYGPVPPPAATVATPTAPATPVAGAASAEGPRPGGRPRRGPMIPGSFSIIVVGK